MRVTDNLWVFIDLVFPCPQPRTQEEITGNEKRNAEQFHEHERIITRLPGNHDDLRAHLASCKDLQAGEDERRQGVDARLTTIIGLSSIAGTIVIGNMLTARAPTGALGWLLLFGPFYLTLQVSSAILAAARGLGRRGYRASLPTDILPSDNEAPAVYLRRRISTSLAILADDRTLNDDKVTMMAVAHRALKNFVAGLLVLAVLATLQAITSKPRDEFVERLRQDRTLQDLLRGPTGNPGIQGPPGPPCPSTPPPTPPRQP